MVGLVPAVASGDSVMLNEDKLLRPRTNLRG